MPFSLSLSSPYPSYIPGYTHNHPAVIFTPFITKTHERCKALLSRVHTDVRARTKREREREGGGKEGGLEIKGNRDDLMTDRAVARCCCRAG